MTRSASRGAATTATVVVPIYMDNSATTRCDPRVVAKLLPFFADDFGNAASRNHVFGWRAEAAIEVAREQTAALIGCTPKEIVFTSGSTEANNLAIKGVAELYAGKGRHFVSCVTEHKAVIDPLKHLELGTIPGQPRAEITFLPVDRLGHVDLDALSAAIRPDTVLVSLMAANNEIGTLAPIAELARTHDRGWLLHTDAVQALGRVDLRLAEWGVDLASFSMHKLGGPVGVGVLFRRKGVELAPLVRGGGQENGVRPGTENVAGIVASALAIELAVREREALAPRLEALSHGLWRELHAALPKLQLVGPALGEGGRLPGTLNVLAPHVDGKVLVTRLDLAGLEVSAGSACASGSLEPSHVLLALGFARDEARAALRLSFGRANTLEDVHNAVEILRRTLG